VRVVTAASLFDGHDAAINIMRRILQASGAEVIHLGHDRSVAEIVDCAIQEDAQAIALTSYQGGHVEYLKYMHDLLEERGAGDILIFGGGGGTILPSEMEELHAYGITRLYSPDDGRALGLQGMIDDLLKRADHPTVTPPMTAEVAKLTTKTPRLLGKLITLAETHPECREALEAEVKAKIGDKRTPVLGITGTGGAGKSSLVDELVRRFLEDFPQATLGIISVDPSRRRSGGALLGDRIRMNSIHDERVYMRSLATRQSNLALSRHVREALELSKAAGYDMLIVETSGIGQSDTEIVEHSDVSLYVMTAEYGAATQLEKIDMLDFADLVAINKFDHRGAEDALRDVRKQYRRNHTRFEDPDDTLPIYGTVASKFGDAGTDKLYRAVMDTMVEKAGSSLRSSFEPRDAEEVRHVIPPARTRYLAEIAERSDEHDARVEAQCALASRAYQLHGALLTLRGETGGEDVLPELSARPDDSDAVTALLEAYADCTSRLDHDARQTLRGFPELRRRYTADDYVYEVRGKEIRQPLFTESLSHLRIPKVCLPKSRDWGDLLRFFATENVPGEFPYAAGVFPLKRKGEAPARMFAGEGGPERTNRRFHYVSHLSPAKRLSTAFDSVTLYGEDPARRPDIWGKVGNSGVSVATVDDAKRLYSGFDLSSPNTSVSMTINGPAPMLLGFFLNTAIDQACEKWARAEGRVDEVEAAIARRYAQTGTTRPVYGGDLPEGHDGLGLMLLGVSGDEVVPAEVYARLKADTLSRVRGTVQADILKEDQAQNTCIFSTEFALQMMGDVQQYFIDHAVRNFYSVSISGYHIAEAGANPLTQLAFTLANGFTYVEAYLARGMKVDDFAPNFSFFFSNGMDAEYSVMGRVARRIWAKAMKNRYGASPRSQMLKYHIQTSGRSLHAQEIAFNDIRTTLQALYALYDNCNSLHTNAYDEAITTPTEESVRRAMAIQLIINEELGQAKNENPLQGSFVIDELTELVERAVLDEMRRISERGGVLGAMERMYQRMRIQEESLLYETRKHTGELPIIGVNTFLDPEGSQTVLPKEVIRSTTEEKERALANLELFQSHHAAQAPEALAGLKRAAVRHDNLFERLMEVTKVASLGQISGALYGVGGEYRRNM